MLMPADLFHWQNACVHCLVKLIRFIGFIRCWNKKMVFLDNNRPSMIFLLEKASGTFVLLFYQKTAIWNLWNRKKMTGMRQTSVCLLEQNLRLLCLEHWVKGGSINYHRKVCFMSAFLHFVILWPLFGSIYLFVQSYSSLYSFTHKQIDLKK